MNPILGVILKLASALLFTVMSTLIKWLGEAVPTGEVVFARSIFALIPIFAYLSWRLAGERRAAGQGAPSAADIARSFAAAVHTKRPFGHLWRGLLGGSAMALSFSAIRLLPLTDAVTISYAAPLITVLLAPFVLQERVGIYRLSAVFIGFAGVVMVLSPHLFSGEQQRGDGALLGAMLALGSAFCVSFAMLQVRKLTQTESTMSITFYFAMTCTMFGLSTAPFGWVMPPLVIAVTLVLVGILGGPKPSPDLRQRRHGQRQQRRHCHHDRADGQRHPNCRAEEREPPIDGHGDNHRDEQHRDRDRDCP